MSIDTAVEFKITLTQICAHAHTADAKNLDRSEWHHVTRQGMLTLLFELRQSCYDISEFLSRADTVASRQLREIETRPM